MGKYSISVNQDLIDNLVKLRNEKIAIKLDVERVELEALQGANQLLKNNRCFIIIETNKNKDGVFKYLKSLNFHQINHNFDSEDYFFYKFFIMAEREGFEPSKPLTVYTLSKRAPSTTRPPLLLVTFILNKF